MLDFVVVKNGVLRGIFLTFSFQPARGRNLTQRNSAHYARSFSVVF